MRGAILALIILCCGPAAAYADGTVFVQGMAKTRIPDQSALITFDGKTERLVIETSVEGEGTEFAWVVPVPSMPKVEAATPGLFPTLRMITRPRVVGYSNDWPVLPVIGLILGTGIWVAIYTREWGAVLVTFLLLLVLGGMLLPALAHAGVSPMPVMSSGVSVLERKTVGLYETATISGADGKNIADWLNSNGFKVSGSIQDALTQYAKEGWVFVAGRIRRDSAEVGGFRPHPLSFTFAASRAVYPMRLTGVENGPLGVDLYAVGDQEAAAAPFARHRAGRLQVPQPNGFADRDDVVPLAHELLQSYCKGFSAITLLSATLSPEQMKADVYLTWKPLSPFRHVYYMREGALSWASEFSVGFFLLLTTICAVQYRPQYQGGPAAWKSLLARTGIALGSIGIILGAGGLFSGEALYGLVLICSLAMLVLAWRRAADYDRQWRAIQRSQATPPRPPLAAVMILVLAPILLGSCVYLVLPKVSDANVRRVHYFFFKGNHETILRNLGEMEPAEDSAAAVAAYRKETASIIAEWTRGTHANAFNNPFSGKPFREEDSPGNYVIEIKGDKATYFYFDDAGKKIKLGVIGAQGVKEGH